MKWQEHNDGPCIVAPCPDVEEESESPRKKHKKSKHKKHKKSSDGHHHHHSERREHKKKKKEKKQREHDPEGGGGLKLKIKLGGQTLSTAKWVLQINDTMDLAYLVSYTTDIVRSNNTCIGMGKWGGVRVERIQCWIM